MCLLLIAHEMHPAHPLVLLANRDEFRARPTAPLGFWPNEPQLLAGKDLLAGGTWLGVTRSGRIAAVTNYREPGAHRSGAPSRGNLVHSYLSADLSPRDWLAKLSPRDASYNGFNLICGDLAAPPAERFFYHSNRDGGTRPLPVGLRGLSNHLLDTPWPKVARGKSRLQAALRDSHPLDPEDLLDILADTTRPPDAELPDTGVGLELERILSSAFITGLEYGTRSSSVILLDRSGLLTFMERTFAPDPAIVRPLETLRFQLRLGRDD